MARSKSPSPPARASKKRSSRRSSDDDSDDSDEDELLRKKTERSEKRMKSKTTGGKLDSRAAENERSKEEGEIHLEDKGRVKTTESDAKKTTKPLVVKNNTNGRAGGAYVPPFKLAQMMREIEDKSSPEYQRITWEALKKSINGLVNKINSSNVKNIVPELFNENLVRGKGLFARSVMKSQMASPQFSPVFAALVAVTNTKFPELGELVVKRVVLQFRRAFKRNDKSVCVAATKFLASLVNQQVVHELLALELCTLLLTQPTDDSVEVAIEFIKECGYALQDLSPQGSHGIFERFRGILHEGEIDKRTQFMIEGLFAFRKSGFEGKKGVPEELDLVDEDDQIVHEISLDDEVEANASLDVFKFDPNYEENEKKYVEIKKEILGEESSSSDESGSDESGSDESGERRRGTCSSCADDHAKHHRRHGNQPGEPSPNHLPYHNVLFRL
ncbi:unnamed protein product [Bathycoccus prasinos]